MFRTGIRIKPISGLLIGCDNFRAHLCCIHLVDSNQSPLHGDGRMNGDRHLICKALTTTNTDTGPDRTMTHESISACQTQNGRIVTDGRRTKKYL